MIIRLALAATAKVSVIREDRIDVQLDDPDHTVHVDMTADVALALAFNLLDGCAELDPTAVDPEDVRAAIEPRCTFITGVGGSAYTDPRRCGRPALIRVTDADGDEGYACDRHAAHTPAYNVLRAMARKHGRG